MPHSIVFNSERKVSGLRPDEKILNEHLTGVEFRLGVEDNKWDIVESTLDWPKRIFWIESSLPIPGKDKYYFLFDLDSYPNQAPTSVPWDVDKNYKLEFSQWPKGNERINMAFNSGWNNGSALYLPCDRLAMPGHEAWRQQSPNLWWTPEKTIVHYLRIIYGYLN